MLRVAFSRVASSSSSSSSRVCWSSFATTVSRPNRAWTVPTTVTLRNESAKRSPHLRAFSSDSGQKKDGDSNAETDEQQLVKLTPGEKVVAGTRLAVWGGVAVLASVCAFYIGKELFPTRMSPNKVFDRAFEKIRSNDVVNRRFGGPLKAYGRDHGGHREGRRNFIEHTEYVDKEDGSKRTRVRFNLEGQFGTAFVFAEVSNDMGSGEFVYILVQDKRNGQVTAVVDNRSALMAKRMAGGSKEGMAAFQNLLSGGGGAGGGSNSA